MRIIDYMRERGLDDAGFAARFNDGLPAADHCSVYAVKKWKYGERVPDAGRILRIEAITEGLVALRDWQRRGAATASAAAEGRA